MDTQHNIIKLYKMNIHKEKTNKLSGECWDIFHEYGGYDYNDEMLYQLQGLDACMSECRNEIDWEDMVEKAETTNTWFKHIEKIRILQESMPESLYC